MMTVGVAERLSGRHRARRRAVAFSRRGGAWRWAELHCPVGHKELLSPGVDGRLKVSTRPCPRGDGGICAIPERTLVASPGMLEVRSRAQVLADFPDLDLEGPLEPVRDAKTLRDAFRSMGDPGELNRFLHSYADQDSDVAREESKALLVALVRLTETKSREVLVYCEPCGDLFTKRVP